MADTSTLSPHWQRIRESTQEILNVRKEVTRDRSVGAKTIDAVGQALSRPVFFIAALGGHLVWVALNLPIYPWFEPWDPYPFMFLATFASAEAPFIALLVLMFQQRSSRIGELREETILQVSLHLERQMSVMMRMVEEVHDGLGVATQVDRDTLDRLEQDFDPKRLMQHLRQDLREEDGADSATSL